MAIRKVHKVDIDGARIKNLKAWKSKNPKKLYFDSEYERQCYLLLDKAKFRFDFQPTARELVPKFETWALSKSRTKKEIFKSTVRPLTYTTDFAVYCNDGTTVFIEAKGFFHRDSRIRYKLFQHSLGPKEISLLAFDNRDVMRDIKAIINIINEHFGGSSRSKSTKKAAKITKL